MKRILLILSLLSLLFLLAACGGANADAGNPTTGIAQDENSTNTVIDNGGGETAAAADTSGQETESTSTAAGESNSPTSGAARLTEDFAGALTVQAQLALGTVQLEETTLAVGEAQAAELLPLWQALQTLSQSDTTAGIELQAVINSIQDSMTPEQLAAIAAMQLTEESMNALIGSGELEFFRGGRGTGSAGSIGAGGAGGGGFPGAGFSGGGFPGGGPGGGGGPEGDFGGFGGGNLSEEDLATRQAQFAENGFAVNQDRMLTGIVTRLLEDKTGVVSEGVLRANIMNEAFSAVGGAAGLTVEELQTQLGDGKTMAEIVAANGGDMAALQSSLTGIFSELPNAGDLDLDQAISDWLGVQ